VAEKNRDRESKEREMRKGICISGLVQDLSRLWIAVIISTLGKY
jgi:hypothetical protein